MNTKRSIYKKLAWIITTSIISIAAIIAVVITIINNDDNSNINSSTFQLTELSKRNPISSSSLSSSLPIISKTHAEDEIQTHIVPLDQIVNGGPPSDGIPSIDNPKFESIENASRFLSDSDLVLGLDIDGDIRAYPLQILVWHEIINDKVGGIPVTVTYCPLCFTNQVFNSTVADYNNHKVVLQFGTSGKLYNSNLVMYDRTTKSLWSQALGQGIVGKYAGQKLQRIPFDIAYWKDWKQMYPDSKVLSKDTGFNRPYGVDPYGDYYTNDQLYFPVSNNDKRLSLKDKVIGLDNGRGGGGQYRAYKLQQIESQKVINDEINGKSIALFSLHPAMVRAYERVVGGKELEFNYNSSNNKITDKQTGSEWNFAGLAVSGPMKGQQLKRLAFDEGFWFEWVAFHPQTAIYSG